MAKRHGAASGFGFAQSYTGSPDSDFQLNDLPAQLEGGTRNNQPEQKSKSVLIKTPFYAILWYISSGDNREFIERNNFNMEGICLGNIMVDCDDEQKLCEFYHKLLGWEKSKMFGRPALCNKDGIVFLFIEEEDYIPPIWPEGKGEQQKQMHFDFQVIDVEAAVEYAQSLGAKKAASQFGGNKWVTMIDLAGHPFCLCAKDNQP